MGKKTGSKRRETLAKRKANLGKAKTSTAKTSTTKKPTKQRQIPTRATENEKLKEENKELKRKLEELQGSESEDESEDESVDPPEVKSENKKVKAKAKRAKARAKANAKVAYDDGLWLQLEKAFIESEYGWIKFLITEEDELELMGNCLEHTTEWAKLKHLEEEDLDDEVQKYVNTYGKDMCILMNDIRSQHQSNLRKVWMENRKKGIVDSADMLLKVALREPKHHEILPEDTEDEEVNAANKEINEDTQRYRDRFVRLISQYVPKCIHKSKWNPKIMAQHLISDGDGNGSLFVPPAAEAMAIMFVKNNENKWVWACGVEEVHPGVEAYKAELKNQGKTKETLEDHEKEPKPLYSDSHCGAKHYGGWKQEGKLRFWEVEKMIKVARTNPTTPEFEEQARLAIVKALEDAKKQPVPEEEPAIKSDDDLEDDGVGEPQLLGYESCDSAAEMDRLLKSKWVPKKKEVDPKGTEEDRQKKGAAASNKNGVASSSEAAASSSNNKERNKKDQPPKPPQQQVAVPPPKAVVPVEEEEEKKEEEDGGAEATDNKPQKKKPSKTPLPPRVQHPRGAKKGGGNGD